MSASLHPPVPPSPGAGDTDARRRVRSARRLTFAGVAVLVLAVVIAGLAAGLFVRALPLDVLTARGEPGSGVEGSITVPGTATFDLERGEHAVYLAWPTGAPVDLDGARDALTVTGPDEGPVRVGSPSVSGDVARGGTTATTVAGFSAASAGYYTLTVDETDLPAGARLLVVEDPGFGAFFGGVMGTVAGVFAALLVGAAGLALTVTGGVLWHLRRPRPGPTSGAVA